MMGVKELNINISGGGKGEYFVKLARQDPHKDYLVLDPTVERMTPVTQNLFLWRWRSYYMPFGKSIDACYVDYVMYLAGYFIRELRDKRPLKPEEDVDRKKSFAEIANQLGRVMKPGGIVYINDVRENIFDAEYLLSEQGFKITKPPQRVSNESRDALTQVLFTTIKASHLPENESSSLPMEFEAVKY